MYRKLIASIALLTLAACGGQDAPKPSGTEAPAATEVADLTKFFVISDAYVRTPLLGSDQTSAYFTITSTADEPASVISVSSPQAESAELHTHLLENGMMAMRKVDSVDIAAHGKAEFRSMGDHVMMFGFNKDLAEGDTVSMTLIINMSGEPVVLTFDAPIRPLG